MGGGDLNLKKSWHPNTMKNQERVWKAEQAAAQEQKRIQELKHERAAERDRAELNHLAKQGAGSGDNDGRLHWMYDKPDKKAHHEDYLLGKAIEKNYDQPEKTDDVIPAVARRIVGSSMTTTMGDSQVDLARKMREDPLLLVKERERAARAALLNNPIHRKRLTELLRKEQEEKKGKKEKKPKKKDNLDNALAAKLNALGGDTGVDIAALLASDDSSTSSDSSEEESPRKRKKKKKKSEKNKIKKSKKKTKAKDSDSDSSDDEKSTKNYQDLRKSKETKSSHEHKRENKSSERNSRQHFKEKCFRENNKRRSESQSSDKETKNKRIRRNSPVGRFHETDDSQRERRIRNHQEDDSQKPRRIRSQSRDSDNHTRNGRNRTDSSSDRRPRDFSGRARRSGSRDCDRDSKNLKVSRQNNDRRYNKPDSYQRRDIREDKRYERKPRRSPEQNRNIKLEPKRRSPQSKSVEEAKLKGKRNVLSSPQSKSVEDAKWKGKKNVLSAEERAAKLAEMAAAGVEREVQRGLRVAAQLAHQHEEEKAPRRPRMTHNEARALPDSLESRIHSNRHYIQRDKRHMNEHFARR